MRKFKALILIILLSCKGPKPAVESRQSFIYPAIPMFHFENLQPLQNAFHDPLKFGSRVCLENDQWSVYIGNGWFWIQN